MRNHGEKMSGEAMERMMARLNAILRLGPEAAEALQALFREESYVKNALIQLTDSRCRTIYFLISGLARIFYYKDGKDITEHFALPGDFIVRAESLFTGQPTAKGIQALADTRLVAIPAQSLFELYDRHPEIERLFRLVFEAEHVAVIRRVESLQFKSAKERYEELLEDTDFVNRIPLHYIASYLGVTPVTLSRLRYPRKS